MKEAISGHLAVATAARLCKVDVVAAYPITPQSEIVHYLVGRRETAGQLGYGGVPP